MAVICCIGDTLLHGSHVDLYYMLFQIIYCHTEVSFKVLFDCS